MDTLDPNAIMHVRAQEMVCAVETTNHFNGIYCAAFQVANRAKLIWKLTMAE